MKKYIITLLAIFSIVAFAQNNIDISKFQDGTYIGNYKATYGIVKGNYQVRVKINAGKIESVTLVKSAHSSGTKKAKDAYKDIIGSNKVNIDSISGATWKALLEDALKTE